jgi:hypothetical protein
MENKTEKIASKLKEIYGIATVNHGWKWWRKKPPSAPT